MSKNLGDTINKVALVNSDLLKQFNTMGNVFNKKMNGYDYYLQEIIHEIFGVENHPEFSNGVLLLQGNDKVVEEIKQEYKVGINNIKQVVLKDFTFDFKEDKYNINDIFKIFKSSSLHGINLDNTDERKSIMLGVDVKFENCNFESGGLSSIKDINFKNKVEFENCNFDYRVRFDDCVFNNEFVLDYTNDNRAKQIKFENTKFNVIPIFKNFDFYDEVKFYKCDFKHDVDLKNTNLYSCRRIDFENSEIYEKIIFGSDTTIEIKTKLKFKNTIFKKELALKYANFQNSIDFIKADFRDVVKIVCDNFKANMNFENSIFTKEILLETLALSNFVALVKPNEKITFFEFKNNLYFKQCEFSSDIEFYGACFKKQITFNNNTFKNIFKFLNCSFENELEIKNCIFENNCIINNSVLKQGADFSNTSFKGLVSLYNSEFLEVPNFLSSILENVTNINLVDVEISQDKLDNFLKDKDCCSINDVKKYKENYRIFKDNLLKNNNNIEASKYKIFELLAIEKELDYKMKNKTKIQAKEIIDLLFLKLNRTTSDHHTDFLKIFLFTLSVIGGYFMINFGLSFDEKIISSIYSFVDLGLAMYGISVVIFLLCLGYEFLFVLKGFSKDKGWLIFIFLAICLLGLRLAYSFNVSEFSVFLPMIFIGILAMIFILLANNIKYTFISFATAGFIGILCNPSIITPFLGAFSEDARNHYLYKAIDELDSQKALDLSKQILAKEPTSKLNAKKTLKDYKDELKSSDLLDKAPELKRAIAIDCGVSRLNIAYYLVLAFCIFALQKTMRKNSIIPS